MQKVRGLDFLPRRKKAELTRVDVFVPAYLDVLAASAGVPEQSRLVQLWRNWSIVIGDALSLLAVPLGHRKNRLIVGAEDNMAMQELAYSRDEILERVNSFMEEKFFSDLQVQLLLGRHGLQNVPDGKMRGTFVRPSLPGVSGKWLKDMCPNSPIARCYKAFVEKRVSLTTEAKDGL